MRRVILAIVSTGCRPRPAAVLQDPQRHVAGDTAGRRRQQRALDRRDSVGAHPAPPPPPVSTDDHDHTAGTHHDKAATTTTAPTTKTVTGDAIDTRYGAVQVQITVTNGKLTAVNAVQYPQEERMDQEINAYAIPVLAKEALAAGSAKIDNVSGATYTSQGYASSLQSALDKAGL